MCFGQARREHHRQVEQQRYDANIRAQQEEANRQYQLQLQRMQEMQLAANQRQQEALKAIADSSKQAIKIKTSQDATTPLMRTRQKKSTSGIASLRINRTPGANVAASSSGTNIG